MPVRPSLAASPLRCRAGLRRAGHAAEEDAGAYLAARVGRDRQRLPRGDRVLRPRADPRPVQPRSCWTARCRPDWRWAISKARSRSRPRLIQLNSASALGEPRADGRSGQAGCFEDFLKDQDAGAASIAALRRACPRLGRLGCGQDVRRARGLRRGREAAGHGGLRAAITRRWRWPRSAISRARTRSLVAANLRRHAPWHHRPHRRS